jgi:[acyl-carrier-protein] S-malonyltransferase
MQESSLREALQPGSVEWRCLEQAIGRELLLALERGGQHLERTDVLQPALVAACLTVASRLAQAGVRPAVVAGHSVGEIPALAVAGGVSFEDAIAVAAVRGRLMAREAALRPGGMLALLEPTSGALEAAIALGARHGVIGLAAINAPDQCVLAGEVRSLEAVAAEFPSRRLAVTGAWHCDLMAGASQELLGEFRALRVSPLQTTFVVNRTGQALRETDDVCDVLAGQLVRPVQWMASLDTLETMGVTDIITVGPGRILRGLVRKNLGSRVRVHTTDFDLDRTIEQLKG